MHLKQAVRIVWCATGIVGWSGFRTWAHAGNSSLLWNVLTDSGTQDISLFSWYCGFLQGKKRPWREVLHRCSEWLDLYICSPCLPLWSLITLLYRLRPLWIHRRFPHFLINGRIFEKNLLNVKCVFIFSLQLLSETFLILRIIQRDIVINIDRYSRKVPVILIKFV
jgi:hypothetical protein